MMPTREDIELYVSGNYEGDVDALERGIAEDSALAARVADEARFEMLLRDAGNAATFCVACEDLVRGERCDSCGAAVRPGGYTIERVLVSNAHGRMYIACDADGKHVALKELAFVQAPSGTAIAAFEREAKFLRALQHPAIPRFVASFEEGRGVHTRYYLAQELVDGKSLDRLDEHWYSEAEIVDIAKQVLAILVYLQSLSPMVIHRDIKPANLIRRDDGSIALVDFGAAYVHGTTAGLTTIGTFGYMPVEQLAGIVDATTDLFALGASLLFLLTRQEPWRLAQSKATINVSAPLRAFLDKLTAADPRERFASAREALAALDRRDALVPARKRERTWRWSPALAAAATAAIALSGGVAFMALRDDDQRATTTPPTNELATLRVAMPPNTTGKLFVDGRHVATIAAGSPGVPVQPGTRHVQVVSSTGLTCDDPRVQLAAGATTTVECTFGMAPSAPTAASDPPELNLTKRVSWNLDQVSLHDAMRMAASACEVSVVIPEHIQSRISLRLDGVGCNEAIEVMLASNGLSYVYEPTSRLLRVGVRKDLAEENEHRLPRRDVPTDAGSVSLDVKQASLTDVVRTLANEAKLNIVLPDHINGRVTVQATNVPWHQAFEAVLASNGLWYTYKRDAKIIRVAPRKDLEEEEASRPR